MKINVLVTIVCSVLTVPGFAQNKIEDRIGTSAEVLQQFLNKPDAIPPALLNRARCVLVFPSVKKVGVGIGVTYGRGVISCRTGTDYSGPWSAPAMYKLDVGSLGIQAGSTSTDYVLLVQTKVGAEKILSGKMKMGADATAVAGPTGAKALSASDPKIDVLTYSRARGGLFAGASIAGASLDTDDDANKTAYGKDVTATQIARDGANVTLSAAGKRFDEILTTASPHHSGENF